MGGWYQSLESPVVTHSEFRFSSVLPPFVVVVAVVVVAAAAAVCHYGNSELTSALYHLLPTCSSLQ